MHDYAQSDSHMLDQPSLSQTLLCTVLALGRRTKLRLLLHEDIRRNERARNIDFAEIGTKQPKIASSYLLWAFAVQYRACCVPGRKIHGVGYRCKTLMESRVLDFRFQSSIMTVWVVGDAEVEAEKKKKQKDGPDNDVG